MSIVSTARLLAAKAEASIDIAKAYDIRRDPKKAFAIVPMRVVGEEIIQAVGYGDISAAPNVVVEHHALSRRTAFMQPLAVALDEYLKHAAEEEFPRIYIPHPAALETLTILAARYENSDRNPNPNPNVQGPTPEVTRLGYLCRLLKDIYHMPGQQIVVVMTDVMKRHFVTGQIPPKDGHLGALTVWLAGGTGAQARADQVALDFPAAAMLPRADDETVEKKLHQIRKSSDLAQRGRLQSEIEAIQRSAVLREWEMVQAARQAFWARGLDDTQHTELVQRNVDWLSYRLTNRIARARRAIPMSQRYHMHEHQQSIHKTEMMLQDPMCYEQERAKGRAFNATITAVRKTPPRVQPKNHQIDLRIDSQPNIRLRRGGKIQIVGTNVVCAIQLFTQTPTGFDVTANVVDGIRSMRVGGPHRWAEPTQKDRERGNVRYYDRIKTVLGI